MCWPADGRPRERRTWCQACERGFNTSANVPLIEWVDRLMVLEAARSGVLAPISEEMAAESAPAGPWPLQVRVFGR